MTSAIAVVILFGFLAALYLGRLPIRGAERASIPFSENAPQEHVHSPDKHDAGQQVSASVTEPEDNRLQVHVHHAEPLGEEAYKNAPADVVLWGDLARALVVRKGSTYQSTFLPAVMALNGRTVSIIGYMTPILEKDKPGKQFLLSSHSFLCDECEPPDPTELVEVNTKDFVIAKNGVATVRGRFEVVKDDPKGLAYRLNKAVILKQQAK